MKNLLLALLCSVSFIQGSQGQVTWQWARALQQVTVNSMVADQTSGDVYVTGSFSAPISFTSPYFSGVLTLTPLGKLDVFIACVDANRNLKWARQVGGTNSQAVGYGISLDGLGGLYVAGSFNDTLTANTGGPKLIAGLVYTSGLIMRCSAANGTAYWSHAVGNKAYNSVCTSIAVGPGAVFYAAGYFGGGTIVLGTKIILADRRTAFVASYPSSSETPAWINIGTFNLQPWESPLPTDGSMVNKVAVDASGNCYATGSYSAGLKFAGLALPYYGPYSTQTFVVRLDPSSGGASWLKGHAGATQNDRSRGTGLAVYGRYCYVGGTFSGTEDFGSSIVNTTAYPLAGYVARYDVGSGATHWARAIGNAATGVSVAGNDQYVVAALGIEAVTDYARLISFSPTGSTLWSESSAGPGSSRAFAVALAGPNIVSWTGSFDGSCGFGPNTLSTPGGVTYGFLARLSLAAAQKSAGPSQLAVYPNPATNELHITGPNAADGPLKLTVYTAFGKPVLTRETGADGLLLDVRGWPRGIYWVALEGPHTHERHQVQVR